MLVMINGELYVMDEQDIKALQELQEKLGSPEEQYEHNEAFINHYVKLLMENAGCNKCTRDILMNFMEEIIYKMS